MSKRIRSEEGLLSIEACVSVTIFIFLMLFLYGFFVVFETRNAIGHAVLSTTNSLAIDKVENTGLGKSGTYIQLFYKGIYGDLNETSNGFLDISEWYDKSVTAAELQEEIKSRFCAYLAGGDTTTIDKVLKKYHVVDGVEGLDFSKSKVSGDKIYVVVHYKIEYEYKVFNWDSLELEQSACSRIWK